jgi:hypothetical protein
LSWVKLDDNFPDHPKVALLPLRARWVFIQGLCYAARYMTDGLIPEQVANRWEGPAAPAALVEAGLWETDEGRAFRIHDYLIYNPSKEELEARSDANRRNARKRWGEPSASESASESLATRTRGRDGTEGLKLEGGSGGKPPDAIFEALFELDTGLAYSAENRSTLTKDAAGVLNRAASQIRATGISPDGLRAAIGAWPSLFDEATCTAAAVKKHLPRLVAASNGAIARRSENQRDKLERELRAAR